MRKLLIAGSGIMTVLAAVNWRTAVFLTVDVTLTLSVACWVLCSDKRVARIGYILRIFHARQFSRPEYNKTGRTSIERGRRSHSSGLLRRTEGPQARGQPVNAVRRALGE
jgi:hypothetical protein